MSANIDFSRYIVPQPKRDELPDSLVSGILSNESGGKHYDSSGRVKLGPPTRTGSRAIGKWQVMPDQPNGRTRTIGGQTYDLYDEEQNDAAGRAYLSEGYNKANRDETGAALYYFGGPRALNHYQRTGQIPAGSDGHTSMRVYAQRATKAPDFSKYIVPAPDKPDFSKYVVEQPSPATTPSPTSATSQPTVAETATRDSSIAPQPPPPSFEPQIKVPTGLDAKAQLESLRTPVQANTVRSLAGTTRRPMRPRVQQSAPLGIPVGAEELQKTPVYEGGKLVGYNTAPRRESVTSSADTDVRLEPETPVSDPNLKPFDITEGKDYLAQAAMAGNLLANPSPQYSVKTFEPVTVRIGAKTARGYTPSLTGDPKEVLPPSISEVNDALMDKLGSGWKALGQKFRRETGNEPIAESLADLQPEYKQISAVWEIKATPSSDLIEPFKAYATGGLQAYYAKVNELGAKRMGEAARFKNEEANQGYASQVGQDVTTAAAKVGQANAHYLENLKRIHEGEDPTISNENTRTIEQARATMPDYKTLPGLVAGEGIEAGGGLLRMMSLPGVGAPVQQYLENVDRGPEGALKASAAIAAMEAVGLGAGWIAKLTEMSPAARQVLLRAVQAETQSGIAAMQGAKGGELIKSAATGALFPVGEGERVERDPTAPRIAPTERTARQSYLDMPDVPVNEGFQSPRVVKSSQDTPQSATTLETPPQAQGAQEAIPTETAEPQHHSNSQLRRQRNTVTGNRGQFKKGFVQTPEGDGLSESKAAAISGGGVEAEGVKPLAEGASRPVPETIPAGLEGYTRDELHGFVRDHIQAAIDEGRIPEIDVRGLRFYGSRVTGRRVGEHIRGGESDLDVLMEYEGDAREDGLFDALNDEDNQLEVDGVKIDINPIRPDKSGTIDKWLHRHSAYEREDSAARPRIPEEVDATRTPDGRTNPRLEAVNPSPTTPTDVAGVAAPTTLGRDAPRVNRTVGRGDSAEAGRVAGVAPKLSRNYRAGNNDATLTFASAEQRDLYDAGARLRARRSGSVYDARRTDADALLDSVARRLGVGRDEAIRLARETHDDVKTQMRGVKHLEERKVVDNVNRVVPSVRDDVGSPSRGDASTPSHERTLSDFNSGMREHFKLPERQAQNLAVIADEMDRGLAEKYEYGRGEVVRSVLVKSGAGKGDVLNQASNEAPTFYSQLRKVIKEKMPARMKASDLQRMVSDPQKGVKAEELKWTGLDDYLREKAAKNEAITKEDVRKFLAENEVRVEEVVKDDRVSKDYSSVYARAEQMGISKPLVDEYTEAADTNNHGAMLNSKLPRELQKAVNDIRNNAQVGSNHRFTKFSQYTLPNAKEGSYRELLLTLPMNEAARFDELAREEFDDAYRNLTPEQQGHVRGMARGRAQESGNYGRTAYRSSHYDEPNVLAHVRFNERTDAEGKRVLFVEEIQSDWHQEGRKKGYKGDAAQLEREYQELLRKKGIDINAKGDAAIDALDRIDSDPELTALATRVRDAKVSQVPDAPFKKNWHELAMKRVLRYAAENGYDRVAWTTGETQAARYDLSKHIDSVDWIKDGEDNYRIYAIKDNKPLIEKREQKISDVENLLGKEIAQKILDGTGSHDGTNSGTLDSLDLKVGGEGMKGFYDKILPDFAKRYGRKWGARVGEGKIPNGLPEAAAYVDGRWGAGGQWFKTKAEAEAFVRQKNTTPVHSIDITPSMKKSVIEEGQPLFQSNSAATQFLKDGSAIIRALNDPNVSSGVHEFHHVFLPHFAKAIMRVRDANLRETGEAFFRWLGFRSAKEFSELHNGYLNESLSPEQKAKYVTGQEKGARGFERYMKTGEAPNVRLKQVFADFKEWLTNIYGAIRGKNHPLSGKLSPEAIKAWDTLLGEPKGEFGQLIHNLHKAPDEGTSPFFENGQVKRALGLKQDASTADVRAALTEQVGKPRSSHLSPDDLTAWADSKGLRGDARKALDFAVSKYRETVRAPTQYEQTGIRKRNTDPATQSLSEFVRAAGGIRVDATRTNAGELSALTNKESASSGLVRKDGLTVEQMAHLAAEAGYPVGEGGSYTKGRSQMNEMAGEDYAHADTFLEMLQTDLGGDKVYSSEREYDYEEMYRRAHPEDSADALMALIETEDGGKLFDKVSSGQASRRETETFKRLAAEGGVYPENIQSIIREGQRAKAEGVQDSVRGEAEGADFNFGDDPLDDKPDWLYQSNHKPEQLGFVNEGLTQESARRDQPKPQFDDAKTEAAKKALGAEAYAKLSELKSSPVARIASEVEKRVNQSNVENAPDILKALSTLAELKRSRQTVSDYLNQGSLFGERELTRRQEQILSRLDANPRKVLDELFPSAPEPTQDMLFQSDHTAQARRQRAYKALLRAKQPDLFDEMGRVKPETRKNSSAVEVAAATVRAFILSNPATPIKAAIGLTTKRVYEQASKPLAAAFDTAFSKLAGTDRAMAGLSISAISEGLKRSGREGIPDAWRILKGEEPKVPGQHNFPGIQTRVPAFDAAINTVQRVYGAKAALFYTDAFYNEVVGQAKLQARREARAGKIPREQIEQRARQLINNPSQEIQRIAVDVATRNVYMNENLFSDITKAGKNFLRKNVPGGRLAGTVAIPIDRVPSNAAIDLIFSVPVVGHVKAALQYAKAIENLQEAVRETDPKAAEDLRHAARLAQNSASTTASKATMSTLFLLTGAYLAAKGDVDDKRARIPATNKWANLAPLGLPGLLTAMGGEIYRRTHAEGDKQEGIVGATVGSVKEALKEVPVIRGAVNAVDTSRRRGAGAGFSEAAANLLVPQGIQAASSLTDEKKRKPNGLLQSLEARIPFVRKYVPEDEGKPETNPHRLFDPFNISEWHRGANSGGGRPAVSRPSSSRKSSGRSAVARPNNR